MAMLCALICGVLSLALHVCAKHDRTVEFAHSGRNLIWHAEASHHIMKHKVGGEDNASNLHPRQSKFRRQSHGKRHQERRWAQLMRKDQRQSHLFPPYPRRQDYVDPLDDRGNSFERYAVSLLSSSSTLSYLRTLVGFPTRSYANETESQEVVHFLKQALDRMGLDTCLHIFNGRDESAVKLTNVIAYVPGSTADVVTVGAHYDSRPFRGSAPGAEDNGSGVAALLAIAGAFAAAGKELGIAPGASVYFVAFAGGEPGLQGSKAFVDALQRGSGGDIPAGCRARPSLSQLREGLRQEIPGTAATSRAIVMDEIGWASPTLATPTVNLESYDWTAQVMDELRESSKTHNGDSLAVIHSSNPSDSDHMSFLSNNMMAVLTVNGDVEAYPSDHDSTDTIENVDPDLIHMISKMNLGALVRLAGVRPANVSEQLMESGQSS